MTAGVASFDFILHFAILSALTFVHYFMQVPIFSRLEMFTFVYDSCLSLLFDASCIKPDILSVVTMHNRKPRRRVVAWVVINSQQGTVSKTYKEVRGCNVYKNAGRSSKLEDKCRPIINHPSWVLEAFYAVATRRWRPSSLGIVSVLQAEEGDDCSVDARKDYSASDALQHRLPLSQNRNHDVWSARRYTYPCGLRDGARVFCGDLKKDCLRCNSQLVWHLGYQ